MRKLISIGRQLRQNWVTASVNSFGIIKTSCIVSIKCNEVSQTRVDVNLACELYPTLQSVNKTYSHVKYRITKDSTI